MLSSIYRTSKKVVRFKETCLAVVVVVARVRDEVMRTSPTMLSRHLEIMTLIIVNKKAMSTRDQWLEQECDTCNMRWTRSSLIMNMHLLRTIYYLIMVHYLCSGLKKMQCKCRPLSVQRKTTWRRRVAASDSNFQVHGEFCINPRSVTLSILHHWKSLEVYFPTQLTDIDSEFSSKCYGYFSEDCYGWPVPPVRTDESRPPSSNWMRRFCSRD
jgi:hypothetical protein